MLRRVRWQTDPMPRPDLVVLSEEPLNAETRLEGLKALTTPAGRHYVRTHFAMPAPPRSIVIEGTRTVTLSVDDLRGLPARAHFVTLECAGNGRRFLSPPVPGEQWALGAVGTAEWTGAPLVRLLERAGVPVDTIEVVFQGADEGVPKDLGKRIAYERSLPLETALREDVLVAYAMEHEPIPTEHGGPLRLVVPGWYGMASVKWLSRISFLNRPFTSFYQTDRYVIEDRPLREIAPRAVITDSFTDLFPAVGVTGFAWSGRAPVEGVDVAIRAVGSTDEPRWQQAELDASPSPFAWRKFHATLVANGGRASDFEILARATDAAGNLQPLEPRWNPLGYMNNAVQPLRLSARA